MLPGRRARSRAITQRAICSKRGHHSAMTCGRWLKSSNSSPADVEQALLRVVGQVVAVGLDEALERPVDDDAALQRAGIGLERLQRLELRMRLA